MAEFDDLRRHEAIRSRHRENRGRLAVVQQQYRTVGQGVVEFEDRLDFGLTFIQKPFLSYGHEIDIDATRDALNLADDAPIPFLPMAAVYVTEWDQDEKRNYVGCWIAVSVYFPPDLAVDAQIPMTHHATLQAIALKDIPMAIDD